MTAAASVTHPVHGPGFPVSGLFPAKTKTELAGPAWPGFARVASSWEGLPVLVWSGWFERVMLV